MGLAAASEDGELWGYIGLSGEFVIAPRFKRAGFFGDDGYACVGTDDGCGVIDLTGSFIIDPISDIDGWIGN